MRKYFGTDGVRGIANKELTCELAYKLGKAGGYVLTNTEYKVKVVNDKHVGVSEARNIGEKYAKGEYLLFLDSDDYWDKDLLKEINKSLDNEPDLVRFQIKQVDEKNNNISVYV